MVQYIDPLPKGSITSVDDTSLHYTLDTGGNNTSGSPIFYLKPDRTANIVGVHTTDWTIQGKPYENTATRITDDIAKNIGDLSLQLGI